MKVAIVCGSPSSEMLAPFDDESYEIWVLGNRVDRFKGKRVTRIFEIHENLSQHPADYAAKLASLGIPIVSCETFPVKADHITPFDYAASESLYGSLYLTSSPAYMISHAIRMGATTIAIYGVDLAITQHEYFWQRPGVEAWIGFAKGRGIKIEIPDICPVGKCKYVEGRDWDGIKNEYGKAGGLFSQCEFTKIAELTNKKGSLIQAKINELEAEKHTYSGAAQAYEHLANVARAVEAGNNIVSLLDTTTKIGG